jgi:hypothetical protein
MRKAHLGPLAATPIALASPRDFGHAFGTDARTRPPSAAYSRTVAVVPRTTTREVHRYKLYAAGKTSRARQGSTEDDP